MEVHEFSRHTEIVLTSSPDRYGFRVEIRNENDAPQWVVSLIDYDDNCGAVGRFTSEREAFDNLEGFLDLAHKAYAEKHAKYGRMPLVCLKDGVLTMVVPGVDDPEPEGCAPSP